MLSISHPHTSLLRMSNAHIILQQKHSYNTEHKTVKLWKKLAHARIHSTATHRHSAVYLQHASSLYTP